MISYEEYDKHIDNEDYYIEKLPITVIVVFLLLLSLIGIYIVCEAIYGL